MPNNNPQSPLARKIAFNSLISSIAKVSWTAIGLITVNRINNLLGPSGAGQYAIILTFTSLLTTIGELGLNQITAREISKAKDDQEEKAILSTVVGLRLIISLILIFIAIAGFFVLPYFVSYEKIIREGIILVTLSAFFSMTYQTLTGIFQKRLIAYQVSLAEFTGRFFNLLWVIICFKLKLSLLFILLGTISSFVITFLIILFLAQKTISFSLKIDFSLAKKILKHSFPLGIAGVVTFIYFKADSLILSKFHDQSAVGIYSTAYKIVENLVYFPAMFMGLMMPILTKHVIANRKKFKKIAYKTFDVLSLIAIGLFFAVINFAPEIIALLGGKKFEASILPLRFLSLAIASIFFGNYFNLILTSANKQKTSLLIFSIAAIFNVSLNLLFIPKFSYLATALNSSLTEVLVVLLGAFFVYKHLNFKPRLKVFLKSILSGLIMFFIINRFFNFDFYFSSNIVIFVGLIGLKILCSGLIYTSCLFIFKAVSKKDLMELKPFKTEV